MVFQLIIKYLHKHSLNACRFSKSPLGGATNPFQPSFSKPLRVLPFLSLHFLFLSQHTESKPLPHVTLQTVGTQETVYTRMSILAYLMISILVIGQHCSLQKYPHLICKLWIVYFNVTN